MAELNGSMEDIITKILQYRNENGQNIFQVVPCFNQVTGPSENYIRQVSLSNPASLRQQAYNIHYQWGDDEHSIDKIAQVSQMFGAVIINWGDGSSLPRKERSEKGYTQLKEIVDERVDGGAIK